MKRYKFESAMLYFIFLIVLSPIFISLNFSGGLRFDSNPFNYLGIPSVPLSIFLLLILTLIYIKRIINNRKLLFLLILMTIFLMMNFINGSGTRATIVYFGMILPLFSYRVFVEYFKNKIDVYPKFYNTLLVVFYVKFLSDYIIFGKIVTPMLFSSKILIYNYYDYFPFFYYLLVSLSIYNISNNYKMRLSFFTLILTFFVLLFTDSRLYQFGILLLPALLLIYRLIKLKLNIYFNIFFILIIVITIIVSFSDIKAIEASLSERFTHWKSYFSAFDVLTIIFPFHNEYRTGYASSGSLHNELLEQYSFFGIIVFYYYLYFIRSIFTSVENSFKQISFLIMFILVSGAIIQSNFSNPYVAIVFGLVFAIFHTQRKIK